MQDILADKQKIQLTLYIKEMFKFFPSVLALDLQVRNYRTQSPSSSGHLPENSLTLYLTPYLDLSVYQKEAGLNLDSKISYIHTLYEVPDHLYQNITNDILFDTPQRTKSANPKILDWEEFDEIVSLEDYAHRISIHDREGNLYNYKNFSKQFLNFHILKNPEFVSQLFEDYQAKNPTANSDAYLKHRFINNDERTFNDFLGVEGVALYEKYAVDNSISADIKADIKKHFPNATFKI